MCNYMNMNDEELIREVKKILNTSNAPYQQFLMDIIEEVCKRLEARIDMDTDNFNAGYDQAQEDLGHAN